MAKNKDIYEMAEKLDIKKENLELGLKKEEKNITKAIEDAYKFKFGKKR